jgi:protein-S-isoprenylcysteine O-methyltransferase Ste14
MPRAFFRFAFIALFSALSILRLIYRLSSGLLRERLYAREEPVVFIAARSALGVPLLAAVVLYIFFPPVLSWMYLPLPGRLRLAGLAIGAGSLALLGWVHHALGSGFRTGPAPRADQPLVREGPYAWIRHPMYLAYFLLFLGAFLLSANWVIGGSGLAIIGLLMTFRLAREEELLVERFGAEYLRYRECTGRFLPFRRLTARRSRESLPDRADPRADPGADPALRARAPRGARPPARRRSPSRQTGGGFHGSGAP